MPTLNGNFGLKAAVPYACLDDPTSSQGRSLTPADPSLVSKDRGIQSRSQMTRCLEHVSAGRFAGCENRLGMGREVHAAVIRTFPTYLIFWASHIMRQGCEPCDRSTDTQKRRTCNALPKCICCPMVGLGITRNVARMDDPAPITYVAQICFCDVMAMLLSGTLDRRRPC
jgi:hypothetical protein